MEHLSAATARNRRALLATAALTFAFLLVEVIVGLATNSLSLLADAVHMFTDVAALLLAVFAAWMAGRTPTAAKSYGYYRAEVLAALVNGVLLAGSALFILFEAIQRLRQPADVIGVPMLVVAVAGLGVNVVGVLILRSGAGHNLNMRGALLEVVKDALGSVAVIAAGLIILLTGWTPADPIASLLIALLILPRTWGLLRETVDILLEGTPAHLDVQAIAAAIEAIEEMAGVHDLHVWTISSGFETLSAHVVLVEGADRQQGQQALERINARLKDDFAIEHTTIQMEYHDLAGDEPVL